MSQMDFIHQVRTAALRKMSKAAYGEVRDGEGIEDFAPGFAKPKRILWQASPSPAVVLYQAKPEPRHFGLSDAQELFDSLADRWEVETAFHSSYSRMVMNEAYQQIIGMGSVAVPFILARMDDRGGHWFWALRSITRENPVAAESQGDVRRMRADWLAWGRSRGLI